MKRYILLFFVFVFFSCNNKAQTPQQKEVDSLVTVLVKERRQWNDASERLKAIGDPAVDKLLEVLQDKSIDSWPRRKAAITLAGINSPKMITPCLNIFTDESEEVEIRNNACRALASVNLEGYEDFFIHYASGENTKLRYSSYQRLGQIGSDKAIGFLLSVIDNEDDNTKWGILHYLEKYDTDEVTSKFINALCNNNWWMIDEYVKKVLVKRGEEVLEPLKEIVDNTENSEYLRWKAIWIIKDLETDKKIPILQKALSDKSWAIRNEAEVALNK